MKIYRSINKEFYKRSGLSNKIDYTGFKEILTACNRAIAEEILENEAGFTLPFNLGKLIILKSLPRVCQVYSATNPNKEAVKVFNLHSYGWVYGVKHKERDFLKYPYLHKFKANRDTLKKPLYNKIMLDEANYLETKKYHDYYTID